MPPIDAGFPCGSSLLRLGFIGGGINSAVGRAHFSAIGIDGLYELAAGCFSRNPDTNRNSARAYGVPQERTYPSFQAMLEKENGRLDAVVVLTPTSDHLQPILMALESGLPVICEKALALTAEEAATIRAAELKAGGFLAVTYNYTGYPVLREFRSIIQSGKLGKLLHFTAEMPQEGFLRRDAAGQVIKPQDWRLRDGAIPTVYLDLAVHLHQIIHYLTDLRPVSVSAFHNSYGNFREVIDYVSASTQYTGGVHGSYQFGKSMLGDRNGLKIRIYGDRASAEWEQVQPEEFRLYHADGRTEIIDRASPVDVAGLPRYTRFKAGHPAGYIEAFANLYGDIHQCLRDYKASGNWKSDEVFGSGLARDGLVFLQAMADSARDGRRIAIPSAAG